MKQQSEETIVKKHSDYFENLAAEFIYYRTYSRWLEDKNRREMWPETVKRYVDFLREERPAISNKIYDEIENAILKMDVMPSMRAMWSAGPAAKESHISFYNCSFVTISDWRAFGEILYILMHGTGVGFSVESHNINKLDAIPVKRGIDRGVFRIKDSKLGWKQSVDVLFEAAFNGEDVEFDYSAIRPRGARLKTFGGRASGPEPLMKLHAFCSKILNEAQGRRLTDLECHDMVCMIADIVVVGGVRRAALISISDLGSKLMRHAKDWDNLVNNQQRYLANNSAVYFEKPSLIDFLDEWIALAKSGTGERGIFNVSNLSKFAKRRNVKDYDLRPNPCAEILLRDGQFCNLSEVVLRADDTWDTFLEKVKIATWIGAIQSSFTTFPNLRDQWKENCEEERLLGVSITGQMDNPELLTGEKLEIAKNYAIKVAKKVCRMLGINESVAVTTVKPAGTTSQLTASSSGMHLRYAPFYIRRYRISEVDPLFQLLKYSGFKLTPENGQNEETATTWVVSFPVKSPKGALTRNDMNAIEQLEWYKRVQTNWCEHNVSSTIYVKDHEWLEVANWVYNNWDNFIGISFLPHDGGKYEQPPYEEITEEEYNRMVAELPAIDYSFLSIFENEDMTVGEKTLACSAGGCDI